MMTCNTNQNRLGGVLPGARAHYRRDNIAPASASFSNEPEEAVSEKGVHITATHAGAGVGVERETVSINNVVAMKNTSRSEQVRRSVMPRIVWVTGMFALAMWFLSGDATPALAAEGNGAVAQEAGTKITRVVGGVMSGLLATFFSYPLECRQIAAQVRAGGAKSRASNIRLWGMTPRGWAWCMLSGLMANTGYFAASEKVASGLPLIVRTVAAAACSIALNTPLEVRKTRFMASVFTGATVAPLFSTLTALWSHFIVNCSNIVQTGTHFAAYHAFTIYMGTYMPDPVASPLASAAVSGTLGAVAGIVAVTVANPLHVIKAIVMTSANTGGSGGSEQNSEFDTKGHSDQKPKAPLWHDFLTPLRDMLYAARRVFSGPSGAWGLYAGLKHAILREMIPGTIMFATMPLFQAMCIAWFA